MGLFSSKKTYVSSTVYNMAGDIKDRPNFLKTVMIGHAINPRNQSTAQSIRDSYLAGPGTKLRRFGSWALDNYDEVGVPHGNLYNQLDVSSEKVTPYIPHDPAEQVNVQRVEAKLADFSFWAEQWMLIHYPEKIRTNWTSNYNDKTNEITIAMVNGVTVSFVPDDFVKSAAYIYALYTTVRGAETNAPVTGSTVILKDTDPFPSTSGWTNTASSTVPTPVALNRKVTTEVSYSDNRAPEVTVTPSSETVNYNLYRAVYERTDYKGDVAGSLDQLYSVKQILNLFNDATVKPVTTTTESQEELLDGKLIRRTNTTVVQDTLVQTRSYRIDKQIISRETRSPARLFIYRLGSGNAELDATVEQRTDGGYYFPFIPLRLDNKFISPSYQPTVYEASKKAYKKSTSGNYDDIIDDLANNESLKDIDYAYIMFGVSLNTREVTGKKYLYEFFDRLRLSQTGDGSSYTGWQAKQTSYDQATQAWIAWREAQSNPTSPLFNTSAPNIPGSSALPVREIRIRSSGTVDTNLDMQISWQTITQTSGVGLRKPDAKKGEYWLEFLNRNKFSAPTYTGGAGLTSDNIQVDSLAIHYQVDDNNWRSILITGLVHKNYIYKGKFVEISAADALADAEESGFLVPLHYDVWLSLSLTEATQLATACCYMVINSYLVKKTGFFASTFFKILLVVAVIAITYATGGFGASSVGLLGTSAAVGAAIGLTGTIAIIAGAVANAIAAMLLAKLIGMGATAVFGDKLGAIIGAVAAFAALNVGTALNNGVSIAASFSSLTSAQNILALTNSVGTGVAGYIQAGVQDTLAKTKDLQQDYQTSSKEITDKMEQEFGIGRGIIDPLSLAQNDQFVPEGVNSFLERTLMTGSDVADMSLSLLSNFTDITLSTELPL
jgi:hypothetical protein